MHTKKKEKRMGSSFTWSLTSAVACGGNYNSLKCPCHLVSNAHLREIRTYIAFVDLNVECGVWLHRDFITFLSAFEGRRQCLVLYQGRRISPSECYIISSGTIVIRLT